MKLAYMTVAMLGLTEACSFTEQYWRNDATCSGELTSDEAYNGVDRNICFGFSATQYGVITECSGGSFAWADYGQDASCAALHGVYSYPSGECTFIAVEDGNKIYAKFTITEEEVPPIKMNTSLQNLESSNPNQDDFINSDEAWPKKLKYLNLIGFVVMCVANKMSMKYSKKTNKEVSDQWNLRLTPAGWAFAIWGIIYMLLAVFAVYQFLPPSMVERNDTLIFDKIGNTFWINCMLNSGWLFVFQFNNLPAFIVAAVIIICMWWTTYVMMSLSTEEPVNTVEFISMRIGFSMYCGWLTTASILNFLFIVEASKKQIKKLDDDAYNAYSQEEDSSKSIVVLYVAMIIYVSFTTLQKNPVYGLIFLWALKAIKSKQEEYKNLLKHIKIIAHVYLLYLVIFTCYLAYEKFRGKTESGLFY